MIARSIGLGLDFLVFALDVLGDYLRVCLHGRRWGVVSAVHAFGGRDLVEELLQGGTLRWGVAATDIGSTLNEAPGQDALVDVVLAAGEAGGLVAAQKGPGTGAQRGRLDETDVAESETQFEDLLVVVLVGGHTESERSGIQREAHVVANAQKILGMATAQLDFVYVEGGVRAQAGIVHAPSILFVVIVAHGDVM